MDWREVCLKLLQHFDENEGTTYLYNSRDQNSFARQFGIHGGEVFAMLREYHNTPDDGVA